MSWTFYNSNGEALVQHAESEATQAEMEAETAVAKFVPPDLVKNSPGVAKAWVEFDADGTRLASYSVDSVTDNSTGYWEVNYASSTFSSTNYAKMVSCNIAVGSDAFVFAITNSDENKCEIKCRDHDASLSDGGASATFSFAGFGDQ
ncbi:hypothetical protein [uncultured Mediterranean phage uvDeep-CGR0-KM14-C182]|nr:hypothetical protein [uncultured Mediterranean phage uvDeep-CGR0-KM14-C182]